MRLIKVQHTRNNTRDVVISLLLCFSFCTAYSKEQEETHIMRKMTVEMVFSSKPEEVMKKQIIVLGVVQRDTNSNGKTLSYYLVPNKDYLGTPKQIWGGYAIALSKPNYGALELRKKCYGKLVLALGEIRYTPASLSGIELTNIKSIDTGLPSIKRYCWPNKDIVSE